MRPADERAAPVLWLPTQGRFQALAQPPVPAGWPAGTRGVVTEVNAFDDGLAATQVRWQVSPGVTPPDGAPDTAWGFIDAQGRWAIAPQFREVVGFVGPVALVMADIPALIDRQGRRLPWAPQSDLGAPGPVLGQFELRRAGPHAWVSQRGAWAPHPVRIEERVKLVHAVVNGRVLQVPGGVFSVEPTGRLWQLDHQEMWSPERGVIPWPRSAMSVLPLGPDLVAVGNAQGRALRRLDGSTVLQDLADVFAIDAHHLAACTVGGWPQEWPWSSYQLDMIRWNGSLSAQRCGVMDTQGRWLHPPTAQWLSFDGPWLRLQSGTALCEFDLREATGPCRATSGPAPMLEMPPGDKLQQRRFEYRGVGVGPALAQLRLEQASRFVGEVAAVEEDGVLGAIDRAGRWLTPRPAGSVADRAAQQLAAQLQVAGRASGYGVVDITGRFVLSPQFPSLGVVDGSGLMQMCGRRIYAVDCPRLDLAGRVVPARPAAEPATAAEAPSPVVVSSGESRPEGLNGQWGYRDRGGRWVIEPRFALADPFIGESAVVATLAPEDDAPWQWGLIDRAGRWLIEPSAGQISVLAPGLFKVSGDGDAAVVDAQGKPVDGRRFDTIGPMVDGIAIAFVDRHPCVMDAAGRCPTVPGVEQLARLSGKLGGQAAVLAQQGRGRWGVLDARSRWLIPPRFASIQRLDDRHLVVSVDYPDATLAPPGPLPPEGITTRVQALHEAGVLLVGLATLAGPRIAVLRGNGQWLTLPAEILPRP